MFAINPSASEKHAGVRSGQRGERALPRFPPTAATRSSAPNARPPRRRPSHNFINQHHAGPLPHLAHSHACPTTSGVPPGFVVHQPTSKKIGRGIRRGWDRIVHPVHTHHHASCTNVLRLLPLRSPASSMLVDEEARPCCAPPPCRPLPSLNRTATGGRAATSSVYSGFPIKSPPNPIAGSEWLRTRWTSQRRSTLHGTQLEHLSGHGSSVCVSSLKSTGVHLTILVATQRRSELLKPG